MPTPPDNEAFYDKIQQLLTVSEAVLQCDDTDLERMQALMDEREPLIAWLVEADKSLLNAAEDPRLKVAWVRLTEANQQIEARFAEMKKNHGQQMRHLVKANQVLNSYTFPTIRDPN